ncbi:MAG: GatB/YqeY domain-containing protein [Patescibacteria group bacterium]|nr:GatB/YqeY domain-containing protein [Patescibacteria group bacterium]
MPILDKINSDFTRVYKEQKQDAVSTLRLLLAAFKNERIKKMTDLNDDDVIKIIKSEIKKRKEAIEEYEKAGRKDLAEKEKRELAILNPYLPEQMGEAEIKVVVEKIIKEVGEGENEGKIMGRVMAELKGKADGTLVKKVVQEILKK